MKISKNAMQARINNLDFMFKGGYLLSLNLGIEFRSTLDLDFLLRNQPLRKDHLLDIIQKILQGDAEDGVSFTFVSITEIRKEDEYGGYRISLLSKFENIKVPVSIDVATGDPITPGPVSFSHICLFEDTPITLNAYNLETVVAEKLQTALTRGLINSRMKDFYDLYIIEKLRESELDKALLSQAYRITCQHRGSWHSQEDALSLLDVIREDSSMQKFRSRK